MRGHSVDYEPANWECLIPAPLAQRSVISRGDVFDLASTGDLVAAFAASFLWGTGLRGYGPRRYREIVDSTNGRLAEMLASAAEAASQTSSTDTRRSTAAMTPRTAKRLTAGRGHASTASGQISSSLPARHHR